MGLVDDLITAGASGVTGLSGVWIGVKATRKTSVEAFDRAARREDEARRSALHHECELNVKLEMEQPPDGLWSYETQVLRESSAHADRSRRPYFSALFGRGSPTRSSKAYSYNCATMNRMSLPNI